MFFERGAFRMKKTWTRTLAVMMLLSLVLSFAACANANTANPDSIIAISLVYDDNAAAPESNDTASDATAPTTAAPAANNDTTAPTTAAPAASNDTTAPTTAAPAANNDTTAPTTANNGGSETPAPSGDAPTEAPAASALPSTPADILAKYTEVMNKTKADIKHYNKKEWQTVTDLNLGAATSVVNALIPQFMTPEDKAEIQDRDDAHNIPPDSDTVGCAMNDPNFIKSAKCEDLGNGQAKITIVLQDEVDPEPYNRDTESSPSKTGGIFPCMPRQSILDEVAKISVIKVNSFSLTYKDCTVEAIYDTATGHVSEMHYTMPVYVDASLKLLFDIGATGVVTDYVTINNTSY